MREGSSASMGQGGRSTARANLGFAVGTCCIILTFAASAASVPLYGLVSDVLGIARTSLTFVTVSYFAGTAVSLLFLARLSDYVGRRAMVLASLGISIVGCLLLTDIDSLVRFCFGRFLHGVSCGIAMGSAGSYVLDNAEGKPLWVPSAVNTSGSQIGFAVGSFAAAGIVAAGFASSVGFFGIAGCEVLCAVALIACPETVPLKPGALRAVRPRLMMPKAVRVVLPVCCCAWMATWGIGGFYQTFSFSIGEACFNDPSILYAALAFALYMVVGVVGSVLAGRFRAESAQRIGMAGVVVGFVVLVVAITCGIPWLLIVACVGGGVAHGMAYASALQRALARTNAEERAGTLSCITLLSYVGAAVPNLVVGFIGSGLDLLTIACGYFVFIAVCCIGTFTLGRR